MTPHRISRVEIPQDLQLWVEKLGGSTLLADEYNNLISYLNERESCLSASQDPNVARHAGFILATALRTMAEAMLTALPHTHRNAVEILSDPLVSLSDPKQINPGSLM